MINDPRQRCRCLPFSISCKELFYSKIDYRVVKGAHVDFIARTLCFLLCDGTEKDARHGREIELLDGWIESEQVWGEANMLLKGLRDDVKTIYLKIAQPLEGRLFLGEFGASW